MPRALIFSDWHMDFWKDPGAHPLSQLTQEDWDGLDLVIVNGDAANKAHVRWKSLFEILGARVDLAKVHAFPGNHEFYDGKLDAEDKLREIAHEAGAHYAQKSEIRLEGRRFLCCTLWTDMKLGGEASANAREVAEGMNDYRHIRLAAGGYRRLRPLDTVAVHLDHRAWLEARLSEPFEGETCVVTHHAPHPYALGAAGEQMRGVSAAYASDLSELMERHEIAEWRFGHTHLPLDIEVGRTRLVNTSIGYPRDALRPVGDIRRHIVEWEAPEPELEACCP